MTADLRTRIAAALSDALVADNSILTVQYGSGSTSNIVVNCNALADAVIRELDMVQENEMVKDGPLMSDGFQKMKLRHRYVTEWETE